MTNALRIAAAILTGVVLWGLLWVFGNSIVASRWPEEVARGGAITNVALLLCVFAYSVLLSILVGYLAARISGTSAYRTVWLLAAIQLAIGVAVQASAWSLMPLWYHVIFLGAVVPATVLGGWLRWRAGAAAAASAGRRSGDRA